MRYLAVATVFACVLGALNLALIMGVIRRPRGLTAAPPGPASSVTLRPGESPAEFTATTIDDDIVTRDSISGNLVGFFSPGCPACTVRLPEFVAYAEVVGGRHRTLAVHIGEPEELADLAERLNGVARLVIESTFGEVATAFSVASYPAVRLNGGGRSGAAQRDRLRDVPARRRARQGARVKVMAGQAGAALRMALRAAPVAVIGHEPI